MTNCSRLTGSSVVVAPSATARDTQRNSDQNCSSASPLKLAAELGEDAALLSGLSVCAPRPEASASNAQPLTASKQSMTARSAKILSSNQYFRRALVNMRGAAVVVKMLESIRLLDSVRGKEPPVAKSLEKLLNAAASPGTHFDDRVEKSTAWFAHEAAIPFRDHLFKIMHKLAGQPEMRLLKLDDLSKEENLKVLQERMLTALKDGGLLDGTDVTPPVITGGSTQGKRNTLLLELTEVRENEGGSSMNGKPLRLFFASGESCVPPEFFSKAVTQSNAGVTEYKGLLDICAGKLKGVQARSGYIGSDEFKNDAVNILKTNISKARDEGTVLVIEYPFLKALGVIGQRSVTRVQDSPKNVGEHSNGRTADTEHLAMNFLLKMGGDLGLVIKDEDKGNTIPPKFNLDILSRFPICRSCHLGMATAVTDEKFPRLNEFNIVYGPKPEENNNLPNPAQPT